MNEVTGAVRCLRCSQEISTGAAFCSICGAPQASSAMAYQQPQQELRPFAPYDPPARSYVPAQPQPSYQPYAGYEPSFQTQYAYAAPAPITIVNQITMPQAPAAAPVVVVTGSAGPGLLLRVLWFLCIGLWLGAAATILGWLFCVSVIFLPIGVMLLNRLPALMTLRPASSSVQVSLINGVTMITTNVRAPQRSFLLRALWFVCLGWWLSALWLAVAWALVVLSIPTLGASLAVAFMMFDRVPAVLTLRVN